VGSAVIWRGAWQQPAERLTHLLVGRVSGEELGHAQAVTQVPGGRAQLFRASDDEGWRTARAGGAPQLGEQREAIEPR
jgi:hypothetical protein